MPELHVLFYTPFRTAETADIQQRLVHTFDPPFTHTQFGLGNGFPPECVTIDKVFKGVRVGTFDMSPRSYCALSFRCTAQQERAVRKTIDHLVGRGEDITLSTFDMYLAHFPAWVNPEERTTRNTKHFFCSQLTAFLLQEAGALRKDVNPKAISPTLLFRLLFEHALPHTTLPGITDARKRYEALTLQVPRPVPGTHLVFRYTPPV